MVDIESHYMDVFVRIFSGQFHARYKFYILIAGILYGFIQSVHRIVIRYRYGLKSLIYRIVNKFRRL